MDVADLPAGGREEGIALVPHRGGQFGQRGQRLVNRVARQMRVGNVALDAAHHQPPAQRAPAAVFHHVTGARHGGGFTDDAVVDGLLARLQLLDDHPRAMHGRAFFVAGEQKGDVEQRLGRVLQKFLDRHDKGGNRGFHVTGAAPVQLASALGGGKRRAAPLCQRTGGNHIGVAGKYYGFDSCLRSTSVRCRPFCP